MENYWDYSVQTVQVDHNLHSVLNLKGKTTLIGVLTGLTTPTEGTAIINGYDVTEEIDKVRESIGVCPQFDILWDELTAEEHLYMFAKLKSNYSIPRTNTDFLLDIPEADIPAEIEKRLKEINLHTMKQVQTRAFSGGMKRRLFDSYSFDR